MLTILLTALVAATGPTIAVPMDQNFEVEGRHLPLSACATGPSENAHVMIGGEPFVFPAATIRTFVPAELNATGHIDNPGVLEMNLPATAGCPETPLNVMVLAVDTGVPGLPFGILLAGRSPGATSSQMERLGASGRCDDTSPEFFACGGSVGAGEDRVPIVALVAKSAPARDGGALFAICETIDDQPLCEVQGGRGNLSYKGVLVPGWPTMEAITAADSAAFEILRTE